MTGNVNAPECLLSADDKIVNIQSPVSIVKFVLYYHVSPAELQDMEVSVCGKCQREMVRTWLQFIEGECVSAWDHPSGPPPPPDVCVYQPIWNKRQEVVAF